MFDRCSGYTQAAWLPACQCGSAVAGTATRCGGAPVGPENQDNVALLISAWAIASCDSKPDVFGSVHTSKGACNPSESLLASRKMTNNSLSLGIELRCKPCYAALILLPSSCAYLPRNTTSVSVILCHQWIALVTERKITKSALCERHRTTASSDGPFGRTRDARQTFESAAKKQVTTACFDGFALLCSSLMVSSLNVKIPNPQRQSFDHNERLGRCEARPKSISNSGSKHQSSVHDVDNASSQTEVFYKTWHVCCWKKHADAYWRERHWSIILNNSNIPIHQASIVARARPQPLPMVPSGHRVSWCTETHLLDTQLPLARLSLCLMPSLRISSLDASQNTVPFAYLEGWSMCVQNIWFRGC